MMPRASLIDGEKALYRDLISLFSHEYLHQWNVKRLRPKVYLEYDLSKEVPSPLLWWFEGGTSWLGDLICLRSGAWTEDNWKEEFNLRSTATSTGMARARILGGIQRIGMDPPVQADRMVQ